MLNVFSAKKSMSSIIKSVQSKSSLSPVAQRLFELTIHYQQQEQNNQNNHASSSSSSSSINPIELNKRLIEKIKDLLKLIAKSKQNGSIEELERAILNTDPTTKCVTIKRSSTIKLTRSSGSNVVVEYCCLWRWPDLANENELKPVGYCLHAFHYEQNNICINPYHYERIPSIYSLRVPRLPPEVVQNIPDLRTSSAMADATAITQIPENRTYEIPFQQQSSLSPDSHTSQDSFHSSYSSVNNDETTETIMPMDLDVPHSVAQSNSSQEVIAPSEQVLLQEPREWCRISYYEFSNRVGEQFIGTQSQVIIDGYTHPSDAERFCLGGLTDSRRTEEINEVRYYIGRGVKLFHIRGNVFAECLSDCAVFVQSPIANKKFSWHPATVCKIPSNVRLQIFDIDVFKQILAAAINEGYESVYNLMKMCIIRMSLVKGWGEEYRRKSITNTPCWIEIFLDIPLKWLDTVIFTMRGPDQSINSVS